MKQLLFMLSTVIIALQATERLANAQPAQSQEAPSEVDPSVQTRALFRRGLAAYNSGQIETARELFLQAWTIRPSADVAMELAQTELDLGRHTQAAEHLEYALHNFTPSINEKMRAIARHAYAEALRHVTRLNIEVNLNGAEVLLNGRALGKSPLPGTVYVEPGNYVVQASLGGAAASQTLTAELGNELPIALVLAPSAVADASRPNDGMGLQARSAQGSPSDEHGSRASLAIVAVGSALAVAGIATGIGLRLASNAKEDDAKKLSMSLGDQSCSGANAGSPACASLRETLQTSDRDRNWSTGCLVVGSAVLAATATYWFWPRKRARAPSSDLHVNAAGAPGSAGLLISGAF